jgi:hypothetical protein
VQQLCEKASAEVAEGQGVRIANFLCPGNYAVSGGLDGCAVVEKIAKPDFKVGLVSLTADWWYLNMTAAAACGGPSPVLLGHTVAGCPLREGGMQLGQAKLRWRQMCSSPTSVLHCWRGRQYPPLQRA